MLSLPHDGFAGARAADGIAGPTAAGSNPHDVGGVVCHGGDQYVVAVGDDHRIRMRVDARAQFPFDHVDLADPVELIAAEIQQHDHFRVHGVGYVGGDVQFVDLECRQRRIGTRGQGGHDPGIHVGAVGLRGDVTECRERCGGHTRGRRLAVGAGDHDGALAASELSHERRSILRAISPPIIEPLPRPAFCDAQDAAAAARMASFPRAVIDSPVPTARVWHRASSDAESRRW